MNTEGLGANPTVRDPFHDKVVRITRGTGSFGRAMATRQLQREPREIRIFSPDEKKQETMRIELNDRRLHFVISDVRAPDIASATSPS